MPSMAHIEPFGFQAMSMDGLARQVGVLERDLPVLQPGRRSRAVGATKRPSPWEIAIECRSPTAQCSTATGLLSEATRVRDDAALVAADEVEGQRRAASSSVSTDLAVGHQTQLDERLEAVADAAASGRRAAPAASWTPSLDGGVAEERGDELAGAVRLVAAGEAAGQNDHLRALSDAFAKLLHADGAHAAALRLSHDDDLRLAPPASSNRARRCRIRSWCRGTPESGTAGFAHLDWRGAMRCARVIGESWLRCSSGAAAVGRRTRSPACLRRHSSSCVHGDGLRRRSVDLAVVGGDARPASSRQFVCRFDQECRRSA